jgi:protein-disulfide isomerase
MASGKKSKERRRAAAAAPPPVRSRGGHSRTPTTAGRQASPRVLMIAGLVVLAIIAAVVAIVVLTGGSKSGTPKNVPTTGSLTNALTLPGSSEVEAMYKGIPQSGTTLGKTGAPVTMTEYVDLQCPYCQEFETQTLPGIVKDYVRPGKLRIVMRPWAFLGPDSITGQHATLAASIQNKAFNYASVLYNNQGQENTGWLNQTMVTSAAASVPGMDVPKLLSDQNGPTVKALAGTVDALATADDVNSTPTILVGKTGTHGKVVTLNSPTDRASLVKAIEAELAKTAS